MGVTPIRFALSVPTHGIAFTPFPEQKLHYTLQWKEANIKQFIIYSILKKAQFSRVLELLNFSLQKREYFIARG